MPLDQLSHAKIGDYYKDLSSDLKSFAKIAQSNALFGGIADIYTAASSLSNNKSASWSYSIPSLTFDLPISSILWPKTAVSASCRVSISMEGELNPDTSKLGVSSQIKVWQVNLELDVIDNDQSDWYQCWHFDMHPDGNPPPEVHPLFHANFGGARLADFRENKPDQPKLLFGLTELASPRLQVAPMDAILMTDFVLSHFDGKKWLMACSLPGYVNLVAKAQQRVWASYVNDLAHFFNSNDHVRAKHPARRLWPNLAVPPLAV